MVQFNHDNRTQLDSLLEKIKGLSLSNLEQFLADLSPEDRALYEHEMTLVDERRRAHKLEEDARRRHERILRCQDDARIPSLFCQSRFQSLDRTHNPLALDACRELALQGTYQGRKGLLLAGTSGSGKTTMACAALQEFIERTDGRLPARFWSPIYELQAMRDQMGVPTEKKESLREVSQSSMIVIDDFDKAVRDTPSRWEGQILFQVIDGIYTQQRTVIITMNWSYDELFRRLGGDFYPIASRIHEMCTVIDLPPHDYRVATLDDAA